MCTCNHLYFANTCAACYNIDSQIHALPKLNLWMNALWLAGGWDSKTAGLGGVAKALRLGFL